MGLLDLFLGKQNPAAMYVADNRNWIRGIGAGLGQGTTFGEGLGYGAQYGAEGARMDDAYRIAEREKAERQAAIQSSAEALRAYGSQYEDLAAGIEGGYLDPESAFNEYFKRSAGGKPTYMEVGGKLVRTDTGTPTLAFDPGVDPKDAFGYEKDLYAQYNAAEPVKAYETVKSGYEKVRSAAALGSGPGDISLIFGYMKMLDPGSTVREGEYATATNSGGLSAYIQNIYNKALDGQFLTEKQRRDFIEAADGVYQETVQNLTGVNDQFGARADEYGVDRGRILRMPEAYGPLEISPATPTVPVGPSTVAPRKTKTGVTYSVEP